MLPGYSVFKMATSEESDSGVYTSSVVIPKSVLEDLCSRFLINIPEEERRDVVRLCFQIETAHWFYIDFHRQENPELPACGLKEFTRIIFSQFPFLNKTGEDIDQIFQNWKKYKFCVPVYGAIILNETCSKCLLVQPFVSRTSWGFPKGKVNKDESEFDCAAREVMEETGFDITPYADPSQFLHRTIHDHRVQLYIVPSVPEKTAFQPKTRGEIKNIEWFPVEYLPSHKKDTVSKENLSLNPNAFFMVMPFVKPLKNWISAFKERSSSKPEPFIPETTMVKRQLEKLLEKEDSRLEHVQKQAALERCRKLQQERFTLQHELGHPLRLHHQVQFQRARAARGYLDVTATSDSTLVQDRGDTTRSNFKILQRPGSAKEQEEPPSPLLKFFPNLHERRTEFGYGLDHLARNVQQEVGPVGILPTPPTPGGVVQTGIPWPVGAQPPVPQNLAPGFHRLRPISAEEPHDSLEKLITSIPEHESDDLSKASTSENTFSFSAPAFLNFKFDKEPILSCLPR